MSTFGTLHNVAASASLTQLVVAQHQLVVAPHQLVLAVDQVAPVLEVASQWSMARHQSVAGPTGAQWIVRLACLVGQAATLVLGWGLSPRMAWCVRTF